MGTVSATRTELLARRAQIRLAGQGCDLLEEKRDALLKQLREDLRAVLAGSEALERAAAQARRTLGAAEALDGPERVRSASLAAAGEVFVTAGSATIVGVRVPVIELLPSGRPCTRRGYSLSGSSARTDAVAQSFEAEVDLILERAARETRLRRLAAEVQSTTRRVNVLRNVVLPRLEREGDAIEIVLEEREREDLFRLKRSAGGRR